MAGNKYISNNAGVLTEVASANSSAGAGDANKIVSLNASGILPASIVNSVTSSGGAGDAAKVVALDGSGRIDATMMPSGVGADTALVQASENLAAGDFVNIHNVASAFRVRKADATTSGKEAHGFVLSAVTSGNNATVFFEGANTAVTGATPGPQYLATTAGGFTVTAPSGAGNVVQRIGVATSATVINCESNQPIILA